MKVIKVKVPTQEEFNERMRMQIKKLREMIQEMNLNSKKPQDKI